MALRLLRQTRRETTMAAAMTDTLVRDFIDLGYALKREFVSNAHLQLLSDEAHRLAETRPAPNTVLEQTEPAHVHSIWDIISLSRTFDALSRNQDITQIARQLLGGALYLHQNHINYKHAGSGSGFSWHSDYMFWHESDGLPQPAGITMQIFLDDCSPSNGAMIVSPRSHHETLLKAPSIAETAGTQAFKGRAGPDSRRAIDNAVRRHGETVIAAPAGTLFIMDCRLLHASCSNVSYRGRRILNLCYNRCDNQSTLPIRERRPQYITNHKYVPI